MQQKRDLAGLFHRFVDLFKLTFTALLVFFFFLLTLILLVLCDNSPDFISPRLHLFTRFAQSAQADLPPPPPTSLEHILFGIGGSYSSWPERRSYSELWWQPNKTRGYVWFDELPAATPSDSEVPAYKQSEDSSRFPYTCPYGTRVGVRLSRIVAESVKLKEKGVRWYVMGDDDTVFFTENLVAVLNKYDHNQMYYIGGVSESVEQDVEHSYGMAFGRGGFAISAVLAEELVRIFDGCLYRYSSLYGSDQRVGACVSELGVPLTIEPGFHQLDVRTEAYGLLAAHPVAPVVTLHHLEHLNPITPSSPSQLHAVDLLLSASRLDSGRTLQHSFGYTTSNWSLSISWGYTIQLYPRILSPKELGTALLTFTSWATGSDEPFTVDTRDWEEEPCRQPILYFLDKVESVDGSDGMATTLSIYKRFDDILQQPCKHGQHFEVRKAVHKIWVFAPKMDQSEWKKAPRRYCSEIESEVNKNTLTMKLKKCDAKEKFSPMKGLKQGRKH